MANTLKIKRGTNATIPQGQLAEPLFTTDTYDLYIGKGSGGNQRIQNYIASGTSSQFLKGDGSLDSTTYQATSEKGQNNGYASLDAGGKIPAAQLPSSVIEYKGTWNASTNTPTLADGTGDAGDVYIVSVGGTQNLGSGSITFDAGDWVMYNGSVWQKSTGSNAVASVNGQTGIVSIGVNDLDDATITSVSNGQLLQYNSTSGKWVNWTPNYQTQLTNPVTGTGTINQLAYFSATGSTITSSGSFYIDNSTGYLYAPNIYATTQLVISGTSGDTNKIYLSGTDFTIRSTFDRLRLQGGINDSNKRQVAIYNGDTIAISVDTTGVTTFYNIPALATTASTFLVSDSGTLKTRTATQVRSDIGAQATITTGNLTETTSSVLTITGGTGAVIGSGTTIQVASAGAAQAGVVTTSAQTFAGVKTFSSTPVVPALHLADMTAGTGALYYNTAAKRLTLANYNADGIVHIEVNGGAAALILNADLSMRLPGYTTNGFVKFSSSNGTLTVDTNTYLTTSSASSTYVPYTGANTNVNIGTNSMTAFNFYASSTFYVDSNNYFMKSILELRDNATSTKRIYITADTSESLISTVNTVPLKLRATSGVTEQVVLNTNGTISFTGAATFSSSVTATTGSFSVDDAGTNTRVDVLTLTHTTSGTAATGLGAGILFRSERPSGGITLNRAAIYGVSGTDADDDGDMTFYTLTDTGASGFSEKMRITSGGNVGIGTTSPDYLFTIDGKTGDASTVTLSRFYASKGQSGAAYLQIQGTRHPTASVRRMILDAYDGGGASVNLILQQSGGNVGIGTTSPSSLFHIEKSSNSGSGSVFPRINIVNSLATQGDGSSTFNFADIRLSAGNGSVDMYLATTYAAGTWAPAGIINVATNHDLQIKTNNTERMRITSGGNVGIGTTDPKLNGNNGTFTTIYNGSASGWLELATGSTTDGLGGAISFNNTNIVGTDKRNAQISGARDGANNSGALSFVTWNAGTGAERMRITSGGLSRFSNNATYTASINQHEFNNNNTSNFVTGFYHRNTTPFGLQVEYTAADPNGTGSQFLNCQGQGTLRAEIRSNGGLANYSANDVNLSDMRVKKDIVSLDSYWNKFKELDFVKFKYKDQSHDDYNIGLIAQQVEKIAPEFIDVDGWGKTPEDGVPLKTIYTTDLYHAAMAVLKEALIRIEKLENK